jgi:hypothetical protein
MSFCTKCGTQVAGVGQFCTKCGAPLNSGPAPLAVPAKKSHLAKGLVILVSSVLGLIILTSIIGTPNQSPNTNSAPVVRPVPVSVNHVASKPPTGFRNFKWGSPPRGDIKKMGDYDDGLAMYVPTGAKKLDPLFDLPVAEEDYSFSHGKFYSGDAYFDGESKLQMMKAALMKEFGTPSFANESLRVWKWKWPNSAVEIDLSYQANFARTTVTFENSAI